MMARTVSVGVIVPSRLQHITDGGRIGPYFVDRAIGSVLAQTAVADGRAQPTFVIGIDAHAAIPPIWRSAATSSGRAARPARKSAR